ncbi:hypothetical protein B4589_009745 [Halolamina sp. CBA1230]|uniref:DUF7344 domain-containing protein n=1 Tax=Halolamina sp. CBA1230 TaxID=1853690 RepID=UPI00117BDCEA|nr:hypothetical protein [Halolamina sp. CBA1230]QKY20647.1 hypothetical protein B4589_009745 [Halolamina sp. CBA1230]
MATTTPTPNPKYTNNEIDDLTDLLHLLSSPRRIHVLTALRGESELRRTELVTRVNQIAYRNERMTAQKRKRTNISLYQQHLEALEGVIEWDRNTDVIRPGDEYDRAIAVLDWALLAYRQS